MALGEAAYAVQSMTESQEGKAVQSGRWVGKGMQTSAKSPSWLERFAEVPPTLCKIVQT